ncbi:MAG: hypothetical protein ACRDGH_13055 [Candidatus Limnocylindria bacterium]
MIDERAFETRVAWGAVVAGSLVALAALLVLAILGLGLGLGAVDVVSGDNAESGTITGAVGVWWTVSALLSLFLGGWVAGRMAGGAFAPAGVFLGVLVWALVTLASFYILTTPASTVLGGPLAVATDSVYGVLREAELQSEMGAEPIEGLDEEDLEDIEEMRSEAARQLAARAEGAMAAGLWAAFTLLLGGGAAVAGVWFATEPPAWSRPRPIY